eukprot:TRINITY_DN1076_c0_g1_i2.p1 TRINITY_DN1076_c0_g1~~TRINITY_DN1076_c0_g1_i2.p1  ORF type:complete len:466 (+),score=102.01 TRINITY_DN1076_c0_g1_i2:65-1399(+)
MPRRRRRQSRTSNALRNAATGFCCVVAPIGCVSMLLWAWVLVNFREAPEYGVCTMENSAGNRCTYVPGWWQQWEARITGIVIALDEDPGENKTCTLVHSTTKQSDCERYLGKWNETGANSTCWRIVERSWWFGPSSANCYEDQPRGPDVFDRALPLLCAGVIAVVALYFWATCCLRRRHDRRRRDRERSPLLGEEMSHGRATRGTQVTNVAQLRRDDGRAAAAAADRVAGDRSSAVVTVSAVWLGPTEAAVVMGDAKVGSYPCEVERVYDVSMSTDEMCSVCLCEPKQVVLWPCRHMCSCADCAPRLRKCPLCRKTVARRLRLELQPLPEEDGADSASSAGGDDKLLSPSSGSGSSSSGSTRRSPRRRRQVESRSIGVGDEPTLDDRPAGADEVLLPSPPELELGQRAGSPPPPPQSPQAAAVQPAAAQSPATSPRRDDYQRVP